MTSSIRGHGWGDTHKWHNLGSLKVHYSDQSTKKTTFYCCRKCLTKFNHHYDEDPEIFYSMKASGIPNECVPLPIEEANNAFMTYIDHVRKIQDKAELRHRRLCMADEAYAEMKILLGD